LEDSSLTSQLTIIGLWYS